ncbi:MAG: hypothetical protein M3083_01890 [Actinomycetota bacterium]|nr:hypothetical protein [Actinomycetota bacterium]
MTSLCLLPDLDLTEEVSRHRPAQLRAGESSARRHGGSMAAAWAAGRWARPGRAGARIVDSLTRVDRFALLAFDHLVEQPTGLGEQRSTRNRLVEQPGSNRPGTDLR